MQKKITTKIKGKSPYLYHVFNIEALDGKNKSVGISAGNNPNEWRLTVLTNDEGNLYLPTTYMLSTITAGGKYIKAGRGNLSKKIASTVMMEKQEMYFIDLSLPKNWQDSSFVPSNNTSDPVYLDIRSVRNPSTRGRNVRYRIALSAGWIMETSFFFDDTLVSEQQIHAALIEAGKFSGIGDGRAIGFGRFDVEKFDICDA